MNIPEITAIHRWEVKPGDVLVVRTELTDLSHQDALGIQEAVKRIVGADVRVLVLPDGWGAEVMNTGEASA